MLNSLKFRSTLKRTFSQFRNYSQNKILKNNATLDLNNLPVNHLTKLDNGLRVSSENWNTRTTTISLLMDVGCRYETDENSGVSHFIEHMAFKGTHNRTMDDIEKQACERGASLYSDTTREGSLFSIKVRNKDVSWAFELLSEIASNSKIDNDLLEKERAIVLREMEESQADYKGITMDYLHATAFQGTPLNRPVWGLESVIKTLSANDLTNFIQLKFRAPRTVIGVAGGVDHSEVVSNCKKYFDNLGANYTSGEIPIRHICRFSGSEIKDRDDDVPLAYVALAIEGPAAVSEDCIPLKLSTYIHGSWDRETGGGIFNASLVSRSAFADKGNDIHAFENFFIQYHDTSLWGTLFAIKREKADDLTRFFQNEWLYLCNSNYDFQIQRVKNSLKTQLLRNLHNNNNIALQIAQDVVHYGRRIPTSELAHRYDLVTADGMKDVMNKYIYDRCPAIASFGPVGAVLDYNVLRGNMWWLRV